MSAGRLLVRLGTGLAVGGLAQTLLNLRALRVPDPDATPGLERLAVLLPVRDEEHQVLTCLRSVLAAADRWPGPVEVVVLDDGSRDRTSDLVAAVAREDPRVRLLPGEEPPDGWLGKPWACAQLAAQVPDETGVLVLVDADVVLEPHALVSTVALLRDAGLDLVCPYPRQQAGTALERLVQPLLQWSWMSTLPLSVAERSPRPSLGAANGQLLAVDHEMYRRAGGHGAVRRAVLEDLALLRAVKAVGGRGGVVDGTAVAMCRMYRDGAALRDGYTKSLWAAFGPPWGAAGVVALLGLAYVLPPVAALRGSRAGAVGYLAAVASRLIVARRTSARRADCLAHPASVLVLQALVGRSWWRRHRGTLTWKGRTLPGTRT